MYSFQNFPPMLVFQIIVTISGTGCPYSTLSGNVKGKYLSTEGMMGKNLGYEDWK